MPKIKTHGGTKSRFKITKNGKVIRRKANANHLLHKKSASRKRTFAVPQKMSGKAVKSIKKNLGMK